MARIALFFAAFVLVMGGLILFPGIDLATSRLFYTPGSGFVHSAVLDAIHGNLRFLVIATVIAAAALLFRPKQRRAAIFLLLALALGPGLLVNTVFKDHWGRARPAIRRWASSSSASPCCCPARHRGAGAWPAPSPWAPGSASCE
jgi:lipid A 4'-phosphatase